MTCARHCRTRLSSGQRSWSPNGAASATWARCADGDGAIAVFRQPARCRGHACGNVPDPGAGPARAVRRAGGAPRIPDACRTHPRRGRWCIRAAGRCRARRQRERIHSAGVGRLTRMRRFWLSDATIDPAPLRARLLDARAGAFASFEGWVRNHNEGQAVDGLRYEAYHALAESEGERIIGEALERFGVIDAVCTHRVGDLAIGDMAVWVGVSAAHRGMAFDACRWI